MHCVCMQARETPGRPGSYLDVGVRGRDSLAVGRVGSVVVVVMTGGGEGEGWRVQGGCEG